MRPSALVTAYVLPLLLWLGSGAASAQPAGAAQLDNPAGERPTTGLAAPAPAADGVENPEYKRAIGQALEEYRLGHFEEARTLFERAHGIDANARTLRGLGMVEFELRHYVRAAQLLEEALASTKKPLTAEQRTSVQELIARTSQFIANYEVTVEPPHTDVVVELDGKPVALGAEGKLALEAGEHVLRISGPEFAARELRLDVKGGEQQTLRIALEVKAQPAAPAAPVAALAPSEPARPAHPFRTPGIVLVSLGGAALVAGAVLGALALGSAKDATNSDDDDAEGARSMALASDVAIGVGLASAAAGVVLIVWRGRERGSATQKRVEAGPARLRVRF